VRHHHGKKAARLAGIVVQCYSWNQRENYELPTLTKEIIEAAIAGFEGQKHKIDAQIAELRAMLSGTSTAAAEPEPGKTMRRVSPEGLERMREGQRRRWAKVKGTPEPNAAAKTAAKPKRKMSAAGRKAIAAAQRKRWAAKKAATA
jgi:hypothetical protein